MRIKVNRSLGVSKEVVNRCLKFKSEVEESLKNLDGKIEFEFVDKYKQFNLVKNEFISYQELRNLLPDKIFFDLIN